MDRVILHSDINNCFASIELLYNPQLRGKPVAVCGDAEARHGIVLAKDEFAKSFGVKTGEAIWQAKAKCPELELLPAHFDRYLKYSKLVREIYSQYTDRCEPFGIDESWLDITNCYACRDGLKTAQEINRRVKAETGLTVSIGVSWNKVLAKLGSDYKKPDAVTVIGRDNFRGMIWPLPASDLLMVGRSTTRSLTTMGIRTIGDLACAQPELLARRLGKNGLTLHAWANGRDISPVRRTEDVPPAKSMGNSTTTSRDIKTDNDARLVLLALSDYVAARLRQAGVKCRMLEVSVRSAEDLSWRSHRMRLRYATDLTDDIMEAAMAIYTECREHGDIFRSMGIRAAELVRADAPEQMNLLLDYVNRNKKRRIDLATDAIRDKYGWDSIRRASVYGDSKFVGSIS